ncbi:MAG: hypothetical protein WC943_17725 [Elusimicrobiota bacterium]|jgi:hypothetical protein
MNEKGPKEGFDPETAELARKLGALDFSEDTSIREPLRSRLVERAEEMRVSAWRRRWVPVFAPAAALAALVLSLFVGVPMGPEPMIETPAGLDRVMVRPPVVGGQALIPVSVGVEAEGESAVSLSAGGDRLDRMTAADLMETVFGEEVVTDKGRAMRWLVGDEVFILESRKTTLEELSGRPGDGID